MSSLLWYPGHDLLLPDIVRAEGCFLHDGTGRRWLDLESGVWCTALGHGHPRLGAVLQETWSRLAHTGFSWSTPSVEAVARRMLDLTGTSGGRCVFLCSGSEAVEYALRTTRALLERPRILTMSDSYFGAYGAATRRDETGWIDFDWQACGPCRPDCEHFAALPFEEIGAFLFEPGSSSGLVRFPPRDLVREIADRVRGGGGFVVVNEVTTGTGRTGRWWGYQHYDLRPDAVAVGKGIGNGYPVSVAALGPRLIGRLGDRPVRYAQSHQNDPLGAAVVETVVDAIEQGGLIERARGLGEFLRAGLMEIGGRRERMRAVRGRGLMAAVEMDAEETAGRVHRALLDRGFVVGRRPGAATLRLDPPLVVEQTQLADFLGALEDVLTDPEN